MGMLKLVIQQVGWSSLTIIVGGFKVHNDITVAIVTRLYATTCVHLCPLVTKHAQTHNAC